MDNSDIIFQRLKSRFQNAMKTLPFIIGTEIVNFSKERFTDQAWLDTGREPWPKRRSKKNTNRAILTKTARLKRSPRIVQTTSDSVTVGSDVPYAQAHNDGFEGTVNIKSHLRNKYSKKKTGTGRYTTKGIERVKTVTSISGSITVKSHTRKMKIPRRRFLGRSQNMVNRLKVVASNHITKAID